MNGKAEGGAPRPRGDLAGRWVACPVLVAADPDTWQDVMVRPEVAGGAGGAEGFTIAICSREVLEADFAEGFGGTRTRCYRPARRPPWTRRAWPST